ncbi:MAG TPA: hypothetical protein VJH94_05495 [Candidatus Paceibacterota bacterium]
MDNEDKSILREILEVTRQNEQKINKLYRGLWMSRIWSIVYWVVVIGVAIGAFYFLQPYFDLLKKAVQEFHDKVGGTGLF